MTETQKTTSTPARSAPPAAPAKHDATTHDGTAVDPKLGVEPMLSYAGPTDLFPRPPLNKDTASYGDINVGAGAEFLPGLHGMVVDTSLKDQFSLVPATDIPFGSVVAFGPNQYCKLATAAADKVVGVALYDASAPSQIINPYDPLPYYGYRAYQWSVRILRVGRVWLNPGTAVARGDHATFDVNGVIGGTGGVNPLPGAVWMSDAAVGDIAMLQVNLNQ